MTKELFENLKSFTIIEDVLYEIHLPTKTTSGPNGFIKKSCQIFEKQIISNVTHTI